MISEISCQEVIRISKRELDRVGVMLSRCDGFDRGEWPGPAVGLSLPVTPNGSRRVTCSTFNPVWEIRVGEDLKGRKDPAWEGGWERTPQLSRPRKPSGDLKRGVCLGTPLDTTQVWVWRKEVYTKENKIFMEHMFIASGCEYRQRGYRI